MNRVGKLVKIIWKEKKSSLWEIPNEKSSEIIVRIVSWLRIGTKGTIVLYLFLIYLIKKRSPSSENEEGNQCEDD